MRGVERGATPRRGAASRSIRLERNPRTLTYSPGTMRRRRASHSQRGGRRPRGDVSPTGRVFFTRPGRSNFASRGPRTAVHCTGSGGIYTEAVRLAGRTSHAAIRQYAHPRRRRRPRVDGRNAFRDHELTGVGRGAGQRFGTVSATTSPRELPIPRRHRRAPIKAYCSHVSGGDQRVALAHYNFWPASCCARGNRESCDTQFSKSVVAPSYSQDSVRRSRRKCV